MKKFSVQNQPEIGRTINSYFAGEVRRGRVGWNVIAPMMIEGRKKKCLRLTEKGRLGNEDRTKTGTWKGVRTGKKKKTKY